LLPLNRSGNEQTKQFLQEVVELCKKFIDESNDPKKKIVDFHQPDEMLKLMDFDIPDAPMNLESLVKDCELTLKYQVKTGQNESIIKILFLYFNSLSLSTFS
jgi:glutamate decarboxylase